MQDLSMDIKHMSTAFGGYKYLLVIKPTLQLSPLLEVEMHNL